ncbi:MAG: hypothetical protein KA154_09675 [Gemmatimonadaceae bacterium]|jgi:hypothetical protein|nr:hypothetical protein [Gemmatimonadaceae bacterium]MCC6431787.1 hypothetical protein [Gemmatimonadaceae bacterium]
MSRTLMVVGGASAALSVLVWLVLVAAVVDITRSDTAGRGLSQGVGGLLVIALWLTLALLLIVVHRGGPQPSWARSLLLLLVPASGAAAFVALLVSVGPAGAVRTWPLAIPVVAPLIMLGYAAWAVIPAAQAALPPTLAATIVTGVLGVLTVAPWPLYRAQSVDRARHSARMVAAMDSARSADAASTRASQEQRLSQLTPASPLWEWMEFLDGDSAVRAAAMRGIRTVSTRQADVEQLLAKRAWNVIYELPHLSIAATPAVCAGVNVFLAQAAAKFSAPEPGAPGALGRTLAYHQVDRYVPTVQWLHSQGCALDVSGVVAGVRGYPASPERDAILRGLAPVQRD